MLTAPQFSLLIAIDRLTKEADVIVRGGMNVVEQYWADADDAGQWACLRHDRGYTRRPCTCRDSER